MSIRFILGRSGMGKTYRCFEEIKEIITDSDSREPLILLVPEQFTLQMERDFLEKTGLDGMINLEVLSFKRLCFKIFNEVGGITKIPLTELGKDMVLRRVLNKIGKDLTVYKKFSKQQGAAKNQGFIGKLSLLLADFKKYSISAVKLKEISDKADENSILQNKLKDLFLIYTEFEKFFQEKYTNGDASLDLLAYKIMDSDYLANACIWVDSFDDFTPQEYKVIEALLKRCREITFTLNIDNSYLNLNSEQDLFYVTKKTRDNLLKICDENKIKYKIDEDVHLLYETTKRINRFRDSSALAMLEQNFDSYPYKKFNAYDDIKMFYSNNRYTEIKKAAREMTKLSREKGYKWNDMAVICGNLDVYQNVIKSVFADYEIPFFMDEKREIKQHPLIKFIEAVLEILISNWDYEAVFKYLKTYLTDIDKNDIDILENYVLAYGIRGTSWLSLEDWNYNSSMYWNEGKISEYEMDMLKKVNEVRNKVREPIITLSRKMTNSKNLKSMAKALFEFLSDSGVYETLQRIIKKDEETNRLEELRANSQIWGILMEVLDQMVEILGEEKVGISEFYNILETGFEGMELGIIPPAQDQVLVGNVQRSRSHDIKALFLIGVNDGIMPPEIDDGGFITDQEKLTISTLGYEFMDDGKTTAFKNNFLIYSAITRPSNFLHLSYSLSDESGKSLRPSLIINRFKEIILDLNISDDSVYRGTVEEDMDYISSSKPTFGYLVEYLRRFADRENINDLWWDVYSYYYRNSKENIDKVVSGLFYSNLEQNMNDVIVKKLYGEHLISSVSRLETFSACPFSYFIEYGIGAKDRKTFEIGVPDIGTLFHKVIETFSKETAEKRIDWAEINKENCNIMVDKIVEEISSKFSNKILTSSNKFKYLVRRLKRISNRAIWTMVEHVKRGDFKPYDFEMRFGGKDSKFKPITVHLENGRELSLTGQVDRMDTLTLEDKLFIKIIDYKSGNMKFDLSDVYGGLNMQLVVYMDEMLENFKNGFIGSVLPGGMFYFHIDDPIISLNPDKNTENEVFKEFKMEGLVAADNFVIKSMDNSLEEGKTSDIIPVGIKKDSNYTSASSIATFDNFEDLRSYVKEMIIGLGNKIANGVVEIKPIKKGNKTACTYCKFTGICQFDKLYEDNTYKRVRELKNEEVWEKIKGRKEGKESNGE